jgi:hypothetical protein
MCIMISKLPSGAILLQKDDTEIIIDAAALATVLPSVLLTLVESQKAIGLARRQGYEDGLTVGRERGRIEAETSARIAARDAEDAAEALLATPVILAA